MASSPARAYLSAAGTSYSEWIPSHSFVATITAASSNAVLYVVVREEVQFIQGEPVTLRKHGIDLIKDWLGFIDGVVLFLYNHSAPLILAYDGTCVRVIVTYQRLTQFSKAVHYFIRGTQSEALELPDVNLLAI